MAPSCSTPKISTGVATKLAALGAMLLWIGAWSLMGLSPCPLATWVGIPCPSCGMTRAFWALLHGDVARALRLHPFVMVLPPSLVLAVFYVAAPESLRRRVLCAIPKRVTRAVLFALLCAWLSVWVLRGFGYLGGPVEVRSVFNVTRHELPQ